VALACAACSGSPDQDTPAAVVEAVYEHVAAGEFEQACELVLPQARDAYARQGGSCQAALADQYDPEDRASLADPQVDEDSIEVNGDTARVPESAVKFGGEPSGDGRTDLVRQDGKWWISGGSG
jgi:hypothetical protein